MLQQDSVIRRRWRSGPSLGRRKLRCLFNGSGTNRRCIRGNRPFLPCRRAGRRARSPWCAFPGRRPGRRSTALAGKIPAPRMATRVLLRDVARQPIDDAVVLWFPGPASATGEDVAEFHVHGGRAVLAALFGALSAFENVRAAEPGEFTRRAFENGKLDLTEAEGLDDLIHADTDRQRRQALRQLKGLLGDKARDWRARIIEASALIEAGIDFSDEGDVPAELIAPALAKIKTLLGEIEEVLAAQGRSERLRDGLVVAIAGPPNVGKSTLMNRAGAARGRDRLAACRHHARRHRGATRSRRLSGDGDRHRRHSRDRRSGRAGGCPPGPGARGGSRPRACGWPMRRSKAFWTPGHAPVWMVRNKIDLDAARSNGTRSTLDRGQGVRPEFRISASRGDGVPELISALVGFAQDYFGSDSTAALIGRARQRKLLQETAASLQTQHRRCREPARNWPLKSFGARPIPRATAGPGGCRRHPGRYLPGILYR